MSEGEHGRRRIHVEGQTTWSDRPANPFGAASARQSPIPAPTPSLSETEIALRISNAVADVRRRTGSLRGRLKAVEGTLADLVDQTRQRDETLVSEAQAIAANGRAAQQARTEREFDEAAATLHARSRGIASSVAPGWASEPLGDLWTPPAEAVPADFARVGTLVDAELPVLVPVVNQIGVVVSGGDSDTEAVARTLVTRLLAQAPLKHVAIEVFDPKLRGVFGGLTGLRSAHAPSFPQPAVDSSSFCTRLDKVMQSAVRNVELSKVAAARSLTELWRLRGVPEGLLNLVVVLDYPYGVDRALQERLLRIAAIGGPSGTSLLVVSGDSQAADKDVVPSELTTRLTRVEVTPKGLVVPGYPAARMDAAPSDAFTQSLVTGMAEAAKQVQGPTIPLASLMTADVETPWTWDSSESLDVVIGQTGRDPLSLSLRTENPPHPNLLVGGAVGQGKSNLVLDIIYGLATRYSPTQLELHLLDFKRGLEFKRFAPDAAGENWLPHVKVLSLESNQEFGVAVLAFADAEMERRSQLFKASGANSINSYRSSSGQPLPRLLLVIDEFHVLFEGDDRLVERAVEYMDRLAKQGRAYGIHLLLASQTTSGVRGLALKGDSIFAQFPLRLSLKNTPRESQAILSEGNKAAAELTYRGEVVLNRNFGTDPEGSNVRGMAAYADGDAMGQLQSRLWERGHTTPPMLFVGRDFAAWDPRRDRLPTRTGTLGLLLGRPIAVTNVPVTITLDRDADQAVAVVGPDAKGAAAAMTAMARSAVRQLDGGELVVLDGLDGADTPWLDEVVDDARRRALEVSRVPRDGIADYLVNVLGPRIAREGTPTLVLGVALQRARGMDAAGPTEAPTAFDIGFTLASEQETGRTVLRRLARDGAINGVHFVGWWGNLRTLEADLGMAHDGVSRYVTVGLGRDDLKTIAGVHAQPIEGSPRIGLFDRNGDGGLDTVVPFDPETLTLEVTHG